MTVVENALPASVAETARAHFDAADYEHFEQVRGQHYEHVFATESPYLPKPGEPYLAKYWRSRSLETGAFLASLYAVHINPIIEALCGIRSTKVDLRAYKMTEGDHLRVHVDSYAGPASFIYYLSRGWKWDWGGLLLTAQGDDMRISLPKFNQLVVLNNMGGAGSPHCVTPVASFALEPRYTLVGFLS